MSSRFTVYEAGTSLNRDGDKKVCLSNLANKDITFCWVPNHVGIRANEKAVKSALDLPHVNVGVSNSDFKHHINQYILSSWQNDSNGTVANKLHSVKPVLGDWQSSYRQCRKDDIVLSHACMGHTHLTHSYILCKDLPPQCALSVYSDSLSHFGGVQ